MITRDMNLLFIVFNIVMLLVNLILAWVFFYMNKLGESFLYYKVDIEKAEQCYRKLKNVENWRANWLFEQIDMKKKEIAENTNT